MQKIPKIGWYLSGGVNDPGARILGYNIHNEYLSCGLQSEILSSPDPYSLNISDSLIDPESLATAGYTVIIFQKVCFGEASRKAAELKRKGIRTVYLCSELCGADMARECDATIAVSEFVKMSLGVRDSFKIAVIPDAIEAPRDIYKRTYDSKSARLKASYLASAFPDADIQSMLQAISKHADVMIFSSKYQPWLDTDDKTIQTPSLQKRLQSTAGKPWLYVIRKMCRRLKYSAARTMHRMNYHDEKLFNYGFKEWDIKSIYDDIIAGDIGLIPSNLFSDHMMSKSSNRLTMLMAIGMPVIVSPVPAYEEIIVNGKNGFIARTKRDWIRAIDVLKDVNVRESIGRQARITVIDKYSIENTARKYLKIILNS